MKKLIDNSKLQSAIHSPLVYCVILIGLSVPISVAFDNLLLALILTGALLSLPGVYRVTLSHPVARASMLLFCALLIAMLYGATPLREALAMVGKYADLAFVAIFIYLLSNDLAQRRARYAFILAMLLTLVLSYLVGMNLLPPMPWMNAGAQQGNPAIFHSHITQNNMMAFAIFLALLESRDAAERGRKIAWAAFAILGTVNILFMVQGRTGYLILLVLLGWFTWATLARELAKRGKNFGWKQGTLILLTLGMAALIAYQSSARLHDRVALVMSDFQEWKQDDGKATSTGERLDFYSNSLKIVENNILMGVGTGGFSAAFALQTQGTGVTKTRNPHNEYLMISVQTGIIGLALLLYLFYTEWRYAPLLPTPLEQDAAKGLVLAYVVNCSLNSALMDHADGLFFAFMSAVLFANLKVRVKL